MKLLISVITLLLALVSCQDYGTTPADCRLKVNYRPGFKGDSVIVYLDRKEMLRQTAIGDADGCLLLTQEGIHTLSITLAESGISSDFSFRPKPDNLTVIDVLLNRETSRVTFSIR
jgi:hypothetical protein